MRCSRCEGDTRVLETREGSYSIRRKRACKACGEKFWTVEIAAGRTFDFRIRFGESGLEIAARKEDAT